MTRLLTICAALLIAAPAVAQEQVQPPATTPAVDERGPTVIDSDTDPRSFDLARKKVVDCEGEKFVFAWGAGAKPTRVTLCSKKNATTEELVQMLDDAATKLEQAQGMPDDRRVPLVQQIRGKISELQGASGVADSTQSAPSAAAVQPPTAPPAAIASPVAPAARPAAATPVLPAKPRLSFECFTPGEISPAGPCTIIGRDTRLTVRAGEAVPGSTALRFVRNGQSRAELSLAQLRKGQSVRLTIPPQLCSGVVEAETEIEILRGGQVVDSIGPYLLRC